MDKTHWKKLTNPDYLGAYSLASGDGYREIVAKIAYVKQEKVVGPDGKQEMCMVAHLADGLKPMILNRTNCKAIEKVCGSPFIDDWAGVMISVYVAEVKAFGDVVDALRIRPTKPKATSTTTDKPILCEACGDALKPAFGKNEVQLAEYSKVHCDGKVFCKDCLLSFRDAQQEAKKAEATKTDK